MTPPQDTVKSTTMPDPSLQADTLATPSTRPITPHSTTGSSRRKMYRFTSLFDRHHVRGPDFEMTTPPSRAHPTPTISKLAKAFVDSLTARQLSDFLTWMLYYNAVELPDSPTAWYQSITNMEMRGWVALGGFLSKTSKSMDTSYGFDLVVLDSICDRMELQRSTVHSLLVQFADHKKMAFSQISTVMNQCLRSSLSIVETLEAIKAKLEELIKLAKHLKPTEKSVYDAWRPIIIKRIQGTLELVIKPRIANLRSGVPLITLATSEQLPKEVKDGIKLNYAYEAMQPKRQVPLNRYELYSEVTVSQCAISPSSPLQVSRDDEVERARRHAIQLMSENHDLRAQVAQLQQDKARLQDFNSRLAPRSTQLTRAQPRTCVPSHTNDFLASSPDSLQTSPDTIRLFHPRSVSAHTSQELADQLKQQPRVSTHKHQSYDNLSSEYEDVFSGLDRPLSPLIHLSASVPGRLFERTHPDRHPPEIPNRQPSHTASFATTAGRRSGMVFTTDQKNLLGAIRGDDA